MAKKDRAQYHNKSGIGKKQKALKLGGDKFEAMKIKYATYIIADAAQKSGFDK